MLAQHHQIQNVSFQQTKKPWKITSKAFELDFANPDEFGLQF
jgi:hypothetical protein